MSASFNYYFCGKAVFTWPACAPLLISPNDEAMTSTTATQTTSEAELASLIVSTLNLDTLADEIDPQAPLYEEGLGLDSIDILEIALVVAQRYGVKLRADNENNEVIFSSLRSLSAYIQAHRA
jgi:acyl carrier protein